MRLIYLSPVPWNSFSQRPHELVKYFHFRTGGNVFWIDPYPTRLPALDDLFGKRASFNGPTGDMPDWLTVVKPKAVPIEPLPFSWLLNGLFWRDVVASAARFSDGSTIVGIGKPSELALQVLAQVKCEKSFYDAMDDFPAFYKGCSSISMAAKERKVVRNVSRVLTSSSILKGRLGKDAVDVRLVLNACASDRLPAVPTSPRAYNIESPVIGYIGTIAQWFDWQLVIALAMAYPSAIFRLIGPVYGQFPDSLPKNVFLEPPLPHAEALKVMGQFNVGLIPFKKTSLTSSVDPIKYYEYRGFGLPILSSSFGEMALRSESDGVWHIDKNSDMKRVVQQALGAKFNSGSIEEFRKNNSWESRFDKANLFIK